MLRNRLKVVRTARGVSQEALAQGIGVKKAAISKYETGVVPLTEHRANEIAVFLGCTPEELFGLEEPLAAAPAPVRVPVDIQGYPADLPLRVMRASSLPGDSQILEGYQLAEESTEFRRRLPGVASAPDAYCTYVPTDALLKYDRGDLIVLRPDRPAKLGDPVLLTVRNAPADTPVTYIGRLAKVDRQWTVIEVDRPTPARDQFASASVLSCHKILSLEELMGF
ncbi:MAG: helix-turn-helix transcriptional regulator [Rhodospirillaceae bacterium]